MANTHQHIDLTTLQEVERLLTSTEFASIDDLAKRGSVAASFGGGSRSPETGAVTGEAATPLLPKRR